MLHLLKNDKHTTAEARSAGPKLRLASAEDGSVPGEVGEDLPVNVPAVQHGVGIPVREGGGDRREALDEVAVPHAPDHDAGVTVAGEPDAGAPRVQVERVRGGEAGEGVPVEDGGELEPLGLVRRLHEDVL